MIGDAVIEAARELLGARNYSSVVAVATASLEEFPDDIEMRLLRARALLALRRDDEAQIDLRECLRRQTRCAIAYRLLGELCFRRDELDSAAVFLREAVRLHPGDQHSRDLLCVVNGLSQANGCIKPTAVVEKLPAATAAVGSLSQPSDHRFGRIAHGTCAPEGDEDLFATTEVDAWPVSRDLDEALAELTDTESADSLTLADPPDFRPHADLEPQMDGPPTLAERSRPTMRYPRMPLGSSFEGNVDGVQEAMTEGFGGYLLSIGALTATELGRARTYQQRVRISLAEAVIALGFASEPTVVTASLAFRAERSGLAR